MQEMITLQSNNTPIGCVVVTAGESGVCRVDLPGRQTSAEMSRITPNATTAAYIHASQALQEIMEYLDGKRRSFDVKLDWSGMTPYQKRVLEKTWSIPYGGIFTYGQVAQALGDVKASRATGAALGRNPMPILIPCHRVVAANGNLTGFSAADGVRTKQWLLELEGHQIVDQKLA